MNDSLRTDVFLRFSAETVACACIFLSARVLQVNHMLMLMSYYLDNFMFFNSSIKPDFHTHSISQK